MSAKNINFKVHLDENKLPVKIDWSATDAGLSDNKSCKSLMISIFDERDKSTLRIDLWTKDMLVDEMKRFYHETFLSMADSYHRATGDVETGKKIKDFSKQFIEQANLYSSFTEEGKK